jgi:HEAT repeat protein
MPTPLRCFVPLTILILALAAHAQDAPAHMQDAPQTSDHKSDAAAGKVVGPEETPAERVTRSWKIIGDSLSETKNVDHRTEAINALSEMTRSQRAIDMIIDCMKDPNLDIRTAAVLAAGKDKSSWFVFPLHKLLNDPEPQVVFIAATTLWKVYKDHTGEDILAAVAAGDRKANPSLLHGAQHDMSHTMHSPSAMTKIGISTGAGLLLGPFGYSVAAVEYMRKNGDTARVEAINLLAEEKTPAVRDQLIDALDDKDEGVRAAAVTQLGAYHSRAYAAKIAPLVDDSHLPVRLSAAAAYINSMGGTTPSKSPHH